MHAEEDYGRLKLGLVPDLLKIDEELMRQPSDMQAAAERCAEAMRIRDGAAHDLAIAKTLAAKLIRESSDPRPSEAMITSQLPGERGVKAAVAIHDEAELDVKLWQSMAKAYEEKGSNIRRVTEMLMAGFLTPASVYQERRAAMRTASKK